MKQGKIFRRLLQSVITPVLFLLGLSSAIAQTEPPPTDCSTIVATCATPSITAIDAVDPVCPEATNYDLQIEFVAGGTNLDGTAFDNHLWVLQLMTKDSCIFETAPFGVATTSGPSFVSAPSTSSLVFNLSPEDLYYVTGGTSCGLTSFPGTFGGLDSVYISVVQRCDGPDPGCSNYSAFEGDAVPPTFNTVVSKSSLASSPLDSTFYGYCSTNNTIYVDGLDNEEEVFNLVWYKDIKAVSQSVNICIEDWDPIAVTENYELELTYNSGTPFTQSVANTWTNPGDSIIIEATEIAGQVCNKITYLLDGDGSMNPLMNTKITAAAVGNNCETVTQVTVDTAALAYNSFKIGWRSNMQTTNHKFKIRLYQGGTCVTSIANPDTARTRPNSDNTYIADFLVESNYANNSYLTKFVLRDTIGGQIYLTDSFTLDLASIGLSLQQCTCFQAFVFQVCDGTNNGSSPTWSTGVNVSTDCVSCDDNIKNGDETGVDCGGSCAPCPEYICEAPSQLYANNIISNQAGLNWASVEDATLYEVQRKLRSSSTWISTNVTSNTLVISNLVIGELYEWRVRSFCGTSFSDWSSTCTFVAGNSTSSSCLSSGVQPTCFDNIQNQGETGVDCGGPCSACQDGVSCITPSGIYADNISGSQARLNWLAVTGVSIYQVRFKLRSATIWSVGNATSTNYTISNLTAGAVYEWQVRSYCGSAYSDWSVACTLVGGVANSTSCVRTGTQPTCSDNIQNQGETGVDCGGPCSPCAEETACEAPLTIYANNILNNKVTLNWSLVSGASSYEIQIRLLSNNSWYTFPGITQTRLELSGIVPGQVYEWKVRTVCSATTTSWSSTCSFVGNAGTGNTCTGVIPEVDTPTCEDNIQNGDETGVDCGGSLCAPCPEVVTCEAPTGLYANGIEINRATLNWLSVDEATIYQLQIKLTTAVSWYTFNTSATNISIRGLGTGAVYEWRVRTYCGTEYSDWSSSCTFVGADANSSSCLNTETVQPTCFDNIQNQGETGIDCGGPCQACETCFDNIQNQNETGVDCGGVCAPCPTPESCEVPSGLYVSSITRSSARLNWTAVSGANTYVVQIKLSAATAWYSFSTGSSYLTIRGLSNGFDYDWRVYTQCDTGSSDWSEACTFIAGVATSGACVSATFPEGEVATCYDNIQNGNETGVDCGGSCTPCSTCYDNIQNGNETGIDCGGSCSPCPTCYDNIQNGDETGVDCGGSCGPCPETTGCSAPDGLYADDIDRNSVRLNWNTIPTSLRYYLRFRQLGSSTWINYNTSISTVGLRGVLLGVTYEWEIRALCNDGTYTDWSKTCTFIGGDASSGSCDTASKTAGSTTQGIQAFPNPASGVLNVDVSYPSEENLVLSIRDLRGLELIRRNLSSGTETLTLDISGLNPGVYLVVVSNSRIRTVQRVVVH